MEPHRSDGAAPLTGSIPPTAAIRGVPAELEAVFPAVEGAANAGEAPLRKVLIGRGTAGGTGLPLTRIGALICAAFLGLAVGALLAGVPRAAPPAAAPAVIRASLPSPVRPLASPSAPASSPAPASAASDRHAHSSARPDRVRRPRAHLKGCCSYAQTIAADHRLRRAYAAATRSGAAHAVLVAYRERWADLRDRAAHRPRRLVNGYTALAQRLERIASRTSRARDS